MELVLIVYTNIVWRIDVHCVTYWRTLRDVLTYIGVTYWRIDVHCVTYWRTLCDVLTYIGGLNHIPRHLPGCLELYCLRFWHRFKMHPSSIIPFCRKWKGERKTMKSENSSLTGFPVCVRVFVSVCVRVCLCVFEQGTLVYLLGEHKQVITSFRIKYEGHSFSRPPYVEGEATGRAIALAYPCMWCMWWAMMR